MGISREQALDCFRSDDLVGVGMEADAVRRQLHPEGVVSYVVDRVIDCRAVMLGASANSSVGCAHRLFDAIGETVEMGGTAVRLRIAVEGAGCSGIEWLEGMLRGIRQRFSAIWIEGLSAAGVVALAHNCGVGLQETIARLAGAGLNSIAGNGVDLLSRDGAGLCGSKEWVDVHRAAHGLGMQTAATMAFGAGETLEQRIDFLGAVRRLQEETGGFTAFVPVAADAPGGRELDGVTAVERLKTLAIARMFLDNIENVQADGAARGLKVVQTALRFGANDVGPVAPDGKGASEEDLRRIIRDAGFQPAQRDMAYRTMFLH
ncbi:MAG TPA: dehypoxanthine futalosine cyclase [Acidobacteriaceae bacterium]